MEFSGLKRTLVVVWIIGVFVFYHPHLNQVSSTAVLSHFVPCWRDSFRPFATKKFTTTPAPHGANGENFKPAKSPYRCHQGSPTLHSVHSSSSSSSPVSPGWVCPRVTWLLSSACVTGLLAVLKCAHLWRLWNEGRGPHRPGTRHSITVARGLQSLGHLSTYVFAFMGLCWFLHRKQYILHWTALTWSPGCKWVWHFIRDGGFSTGGSNFGSACKLGDAGSKCKGNFHLRLKRSHVQIFWKISTNRPPEVVPNQDFCVIFGDAVLWCPRSFVPSHWSHTWVGTTFPDWCKP